MERGSGGGGVAVAAPRKRVELGESLLAEIEKQKQILV